MIQIVTFQSQYTPSIVELILNIQQNEFQVPITLEQQPDLLVIDSFYQQQKGNFWVAIDGDAVVGTIGLIDCGEGVGCIRKMFVKAQYRGRELSVAQKLLETLENWCKENHIDNLYLGTIERLQAAISFYKRNGFVFIEKTNLPSSFPVMAVDTHFFTKNIKV